MSASLQFDNAQDILRFQTDLTYQCLCKAAQRREDVLPFLSSILARTLVTINSQAGTRLALKVSKRAWAYGDALEFGELALFGEKSAQNLDRGEDVFTRLLHGLAHIWAQYAGIKDTSNRGRYHNGRFAEIARTIGLDVQATDGVHGHITPGIAIEFIGEYADLIMDLDRAVLLRTPVGDGGGQLQAADSAATKLSAGNSKYVFAACICRDAAGKRRTIRVARGSWTPKTILCAICGTSFAESLTTSGQPPVTTTTTTTTTAVRGPDMKINLTAAAGKSSNRKLHLLDPVNLMGDPNATQLEFSRMWVQYQNHGSIVGPEDQVIVATSSHAAKGAWFALPTLGIRRLLRDGTNGSSLALVDAVDIDFAASRFDELVVGSGYSLLSPLAMAAKKRGMTMTGVFGRSFPSYRLTVARDSTTRILLHDRTFISPPMSIAS